MRSTRSSNRLAPARSTATRPAQQGFTLIEVLVSLLIFSLGVLGIVGMQARAMQFSVQSEDRARATMLANEIVAQMWAQQSTTLESSVVAAWQSRVADAAVAGLPGASGSVSDADANGVVSVTIKWRPPSRASTSREYQFETKVVMP